MRATFTPELLIGLVRLPRTAIRRVSDSLSDEPSTRNLRIRRLGVRVPPSALHKCRSEVAFSGLRLFCPGQAWHKRGKNLRRKDPAGGASGMGLCHGVATLAGSLLGRRSRSRATGAPIACSPRWVVRRTVRRPGQASLSGSSGASSTSSRRTASSVSPLRQVLGRHPHHSSGARRSPIFPRVWRAASSA
jgi:hypothetical protein